LPANVAQYIGKMGKRILRILTDKKNKPRLNIISIRKDLP
jgi:hypothetical protein